jgi:hypothetical protein
MLGLGACLLVLVSGILFSLKELTDREVAVSLSGALFSANVRDRLSDEEYAQVQAAAAADPAADVRFSPLALSFTGSEIAGLSKEQTSAVVGQRLANVLYDNGSGTAKGLIVPAAPESETKALSLGPTTILTGSNNSLFSTAFVVAAVVALALMGGMAALSRGFGRLGGPAFVTAVGIAPLAVLWAGANAAIGPADAGDGAFTHAARASFDGVSSDLMTVFLALLAGAIALCVVSAIGGLGNVALGKSGAGEAEKTRKPPAKAKATAAVAATEGPDATEAEQPARVPPVPQVKGIPQAEMQRPSPTRAVPSGPVYQVPGKPQVEARDADKQVA